ncbi:MULTISPECIES: MCE family protein [Mycobacterium]|uniref:MCE family protein n=1 Tax=Mycobacterium TaxID=1763 RepID=UPI0009E1C5D5|nr:MULTISPECIES: MlaD family protein [Mycobacterium]
MHLERSIKIRFAVFAVIAAISMTVLTVGYGRVGTSLFGADQYTVIVHLPEAAGLYARANVTYSGSTIGQVEDVTLTPTGVEARLRLKSTYQVPAQSTAQVHSQSAIGEQFVALVPRNPDSRPLRDGDVITDVTIPPDINAQLDLTNRALLAVPKGNLKTLVDESYTALGGLSPELSRIVDGANNLAIDTRNNLADLTNIIDNSGPLLASQVQSSDAITAWAAHLATITGQLKDHDDALSGVLRKGGPAADEARALLDRIKPSVPVLLANLVSLADVGIVFNPNIEQTLVLFPQATAQIGAVAVPNLNTKQPYHGAMEQFALNLNLPPPCSTGYLPPSQRRTPAEVDAPPRPEGDLYCRIPQDAPFNVRGARNIPCETKPWKRAPTEWMCESDQEYVPLNDGNNWKGDPNATMSGQDVPQFPPGVVSPNRQVPVSPGGAPPPATPPTALGIADYNPVDGTYLGPDGQVYTQTDLAVGARAPTLRSLLAPAAP